MKSTFRPLGLILAAAVLAACAKNPVTGREELRFFSEQDEIRLGTENYGPAQQDSGGRYLLDAELEAYVRQVGMRIAKASDRPQLPYEFVVVNESVPNAWAMPGGKISVNRGLLLELKSEAELAAVLGHEVVHAAARHGAHSMETGMLLQGGALLIGMAAADKRYGDLVGMGAFVGAGMLAMKYGRDNELEADRYGITYMLRAGYDPGAAVGLQETFVRLSKDKKPNWLEGMFASHPPSQERVDANRAQAAALPHGLKTGEAEYQRRIAAIVKSRSAYAAADEGRKALAKGDARAALAAADKALAIEPREALFHGLRGDALLKLGTTDRAELAYDEAIRRNPDYYQFHLNRGLMRYGKGDRAAAQAGFERSMALRPTDVAAYNLGLISQETGQTDKAIAYLKSAAGSGDVGRRANLLLARLEAPRNPGAYLKIDTRQDTDGRLLLLVKNASPVRLTNVNLATRHVEGLFNVKKSAQINVSGAIAPGETRTVPTDWNLKQMGVGLDKIEAAATRASPE